MQRFLAALVLVSLMLVPAGAVTPDEVLPNAELEARARALSLELRCMVCQNQSIDDSDADLAKDLRILVRERLVAGDTDAQVLDFIVARYGEFVLLKPRFSTRTALLWGAPILVLLAGGMVLFFNRRRMPTAGTAELSAEEKKRLDAILHGD